MRQEGEAAMVVVGGAVAFADATELANRARWCGVADGATVDGVTASGRRVAYASNDPCRKNDASGASAALGQFLGLGVADIRSDQ